MIDGKLEAIFITDKLDFAQIYSNKYLSAIDLADECVKNKKPSHVLGR